MDEIKAELPLDNETTIDVSNLKQTNNTSRKFHAFGAVCLSWVIWNIIYNLEGFSKVH